MPSYFVHGLLWEALRAEAVDPKQRGALHNLFGSMRFPEYRELVFDAGLPLYELARAMRNAGSAPFQATRWLNQFAAPRRPGDRRGRGEAVSPRAASRVTLSPVPPYEFQPAVPAPARGAGGDPRPRPASSPSGGARPGPPRASRSRGLRSGTPALRSSSDSGRPWCANSASKSRVFGPLAPVEGPGFVVPSTPAALWVWLRSGDRGELVHESRRTERALADAFAMDSVVEAFRYREGLDLTGYEDGTENPTGDAAAALVSGRGPGLDGSSFVAVQQWVHDLDRFESFSPGVRDHIIGRRKSDNAELKDGPDAAHVRRTEQEAADPPAFLLRRSMPWSDARRAGLVFVAFGKSFDAFEFHLRRMVGAADRIVDHLFRFTRPGDRGLLLVSADRRRARRSQLPPLKARWKKRPASARRPAPPGPAAPPAAPGRDRRTPLG